MNTDFETLFAPPSGLCACEINGAFAHVQAISPRCVTLRLPRSEPPRESIVLHLYRVETGRYENCIITDYTAEEAQHPNGAVLLRLCFDDPACARRIRAALNGYARCLETKSEFGAAAWSSLVSGYPDALDEVFPASLQAQRRAWFANLAPLPQGCELAVELNCPELWKLYLAHPLPEFTQKYLESREVSPEFLSGRLPDRLYAGSPHCRFLFPDEETLRRIARKAEEENIALTISTAELRSGGEENADRIIALTRELNAEMEINDWGMLRRSAGRVNIALGPRLNRRRKDPRMRYRANPDVSLLAENSMNSPLWREFLRELGVVRCEYDHSGLPTRLPGDMPCSLHLPFCQTNASLWCPLRALTLHGNRGAQAGCDSCEGMCRENVLLYPEHLNMIGRWNSLLAFHPLPSEEEMRKYDRWVLNF